jgi:hypothetical protein
MLSSIACERTVPVAARSVLDPHDFTARATTIELVREDW